MYIAHILPSRLSLYISQELGRIQDLMPWLDCLFIVVTLKKVLQDISPGWSLVWHILKTPVRKNAVLFSYYKTWYLFFACNVVVFDVSSRFISYLKTIFAKRSLGEVWYIHSEDPKFLYAIAIRDSPPKMLCVCLPVILSTKKERRERELFSAHQDATHQDLLHYSPTSPTQQSTTGWKEKVKGV